METSRVSFSSRLPLYCRVNHTLRPVDTKPSLGQDNPDEWGEFLHLPNQKFHDFNKIREEIVKDTEKMTGKNAGKLQMSFLSNKGYMLKQDTLHHQVFLLNLSTFESFHPMCSP